MMLHSWKGQLLGRGGLEALRTLSVHLNSPTNMRVSVVCRCKRFPIIEPRKSLALPLSMVAE